jgi:puromycin-sensitive aminopeptidase
VVANAGGHGFYRVRYAPDLLDGLTGSLGRLQAIERFGLVSDLFAQAQAGGMGAPVFLEVTARFREETDRNVWAALLGALAYVNRCLEDDLRPAYAALVRDRLGPAVARLGWVPGPGESELTRQLRGDLLRAMGILGDDPETQARAREAYARYRQDPAALDPNVLSATIPLVATAGGPAEHEEFARRFREARSPQEEQRYLYALAGFRDPALVRETLDRTVNGAIRTQDAPYVVRALMASVWAREVAWGFVQAHWQTMQRQYPPSAFRRMFDGVTTLVRTDWEAQVRAFFEEHKLDLGGKTLAQYLEQLRVAVEFREREAGPLRRYLG